MRVAINIDFTPEEIKKHTEDIGRRLVFGVVQDAIKQFNKAKPENVRAAASVVGNLVISALGAILNHTSEPSPQDSTASAQASTEEEAPAPEEAKADFV